MFYTYNQNNSGGAFDFDERRGISHYVIVEADSVDSADAKAEAVGLYFDGEGDCECCGNRWYPQYGKGDDAPSVYGVPYKEYKTDLLWMTPKAEGFIHYADGRVEPFTPEAGETDWDKYK